MIISVEELESNEELNFLFKEQLEAVIASFLSKPQEYITALYKVLNRRLSTEPAYVHRLY